jgi:hypothetical protein
MTDSQWDELAKFIDASNGQVVHRLLTEIMDEVGRVPTPVDDDPLGRFLVGEHPSDTDVQRLMALRTAPSRLVLERLLERFRDGAR